MARNTDTVREGKAEGGAKQAPIAAPPRRYSLNALLKSASEIFVAVLLVLLFFVMLMWLLGVLFPEGANLKDLMNNERSVTEAKPAERQLLIASQDGAATLESGGDFAATLSELRQSVKYKAASGIAWGDGRAGMPLYDQDAVQTFNLSSAVISFDAKNRLNMGPNSLVIVRRLEQEMLFREKRSTLVMMEGELSGLMTREAGNPMSVEIALPGAIARIRSSDSGDRNLEYKVKVNPDKSSTVAVFKGVAEVVAQGKTVRLIANQSTTVAEGEAPAAPRSLLPPAVLQSPADNAASYYRDTPRELEFRWRKTGAGRYRFVLARDKEFQDVLLDEGLSKPYFSHGNLAAGEYYWRVADVDEGGVSGWFSETRRLSVVQDLSPPALQVEFPPNRVARGQFMLKGIAEPGTKVYVDGVQVNTSAQGEFTYDRKVAAGINVVVVEAVDAAGNVTYRTQMIDGGS